MTTDPADAAGSQGGYGTPAPEDEMPPSGESTRNGEPHQNGDTELDPEALGANNGMDQNSDDSTDPLLEPLDPTDGDLAGKGVSEEDLKRSHSLDAPD